MKYLCRRERREGMMERTHLASPPYFAYSSSETSNDSAPVLPFCVCLFEDVILPDPYINDLH